MPSEPTEADIKLVAEAISNACHDSRPIPLAEAALRALARAGRLLPDGAEPEEEFIALGALPDGTPWSSDPHFRLGDARQMAAMLGPDAVVKRRVVHAGPWVAVDGTD